ncbi:MAG: hypothetical protein LBN39_06540 [Planctomycetaceae bacterium]|jgi:hypothetical protein|nr:hypothetical protein [Planctomycetaceae bacterium]
MKRFLPYIFVYLLLVLIAGLMCCFWYGAVLLAPVIPCFYFFIDRQRQRIILPLIQTALETQTSLDEVLDAYAET